jgi:hypothetical protein
MPNRPISSRSLSMFDVILCMALAQRIHGTDAAIRAVAHRCRDKVQATLRPRIAKLMRTPDARAVLAKILEQIN